MEFLREIRRVFEGGYPFFSWYNREKTLKEG
jgi:hypothetical protein